jgi:hypothetical protein
MRQHNTTEERKCWSTARERERLRARFQIRERVSSLASSLGSGSTNNDDHIHSSLSNDVLKILSQIISYIKSGDRSKFSLSLMDKHFELFSSKLPIDLLQDHLPHSLQLSTAWFGKKYSNMLETYIESLASFTLMEYAVWMGKFDIVGSLLIGGVNPSIRSQHRIDKIDCQHNKAWKKEMKKSGSKALVRFFDCFPLALSSYIVKRVIEMRLEAHNNNSDAHRRKPITCTICQKSVPSSSLLQFTKCKNLLCEPCFWDHLLSTVDQRDSHEDVVKCPCCGSSEAESSGIDSVEPSHRNLIHWDNLTPLERRQQSLQKLKALPENSHALKSRKTKKKKTIVAKSWAEALLPSLGLSCNVRKDKFFSYIDRNAIKYVRGCLVAGVDTEWKNEYGQTALYICAWRGYTKIAKLLLNFGADLNVVTNGGSMIKTVCESQSHTDILELCQNENYYVDDDLLSHHLPLQNLRDVMQGVNGDLNRNLSTLIPLSSKHPGAGSYIIDNAFSSSQVDCLLKLCQSLPLDLTQKKNNALCSDRSYYCDSEDCVCYQLETIIRRAGLVLSDDMVKAFPFLRFLIYSKTGSVLVPHVDLCRVDHASGCRSTHTFIVYLTSNDNSGETSLLGDVSGEGRCQILARVTPKRGRLLLFPHACPHEGNKVVDVPKIILRGEVMLAKA